VALPKDRRVVLEKDLGKVLKSRFSVGNNTLQLKIFNTNRPTRISVIVPKKVYKKANDRNHIKRRINAVLYNQIILEKNFQPKADLLIFVRNNQLKTFSNIDLVNQIQDLLAKAKTRFGYKN
jgi:ribonuclease P protein component